MEAVISARQKKVEKGVDATTRTKTAKDGKRIKDDEDEVRP